MFSVSSPRSLPCPHSAPATLKSKRGLGPPRRPQQFLLLASKRCNYGGTELPVGSRGTLTAGRRESGGVGGETLGSNLSQPGGEGIAPIAVPSDLRGPSIESVNGDESATQRNIAHRRCGPNHWRPESNDLDKEIETRRTLAEIHL